MARNSLLVDQWRAALGLDYITENLDSVVDRVEEIQNRLEELGQSTEFIGVSTTDPEVEVTIDGTVITPKRGDIVIYEVSEYIYNGTSWQKFGDETLYVLKSDANYTDSLEEHKFITSVNEVEGVISVTKAQPVIEDVSGLTEELGNIKSEIEKLESTDPEETESVRGLITTAINGLDVSDESVSHQFVTSVSEVDGKISVARAQPVIDDVDGLPNQLLNLVNKDNELSNNKADKVTGAVANNFAGLDANGNLIDSGKSSLSFDPAGTAQSLVNALDRGATSDDTIHRNPFIKDIIQVDGKITDVIRGNALDAEQEPIITESQVKDLVTDLDDIRSSITNLDNSKALKSYVDTELSKKADKSYVDVELAEKVNNELYNTEVNTINGRLTSIESNNNTITLALSKKADKSYVDAELAKKVSSELYTSEVGIINDRLTSIESNNNTITSELSNSKADKSYVDAELAKKVNDELFTSEVSRIDGVLGYIKGNYVGGLTKVEGTPITITKLESDPDDHEVIKLGFSIDTSDKVLTQSNDGLKTTLGLKYNTNNTTVELLGVNDQVISSIDASAFIKDGLLDSAELVTDPEGYPAGKYIKLRFNTDSGKDDIFIDVTSLIDIYTNGNGLELNDKSFSIKLDSTTSSALSVSSDGLKLSVDSELNDESDNPVKNSVISTKVNNLQDQIDELRGLVNALTEQLTFNVDNINALDEASTNSVNVN